MVSGKFSFRGHAEKVKCNGLASCSVYSFPTIAEPVESGWVAFTVSQGICSSRQDDEALSSVPTANVWSGTDSVKPLKEKKADKKRR